MIKHCVPSAKYFFTTHTQLQEHLPRLQCQTATVTFQILKEGNASTSATQQKILYYQCQVLTILIIYPTSAHQLLKQHFNVAVSLCSLRLRSCYQNMPRPWRDTHGSLLTLTAKVNAPQDLSTIRAKMYDLYTSYFH